ncbi:MAG: T9SS type A sorting domain-containing protein [Ignavibacteriales bacterium]|nr:T9SS type A sorting domain-containing protein [Ignavibacteriales bacterium]
MRVSVSDGDDAVNNNFINAYPGKISARVYTDTDGKFGTSVDRIQKQWVVRIYQDSISASSLVDFTNDTIFTFIGTPGTYIISIADSGSQWVTIGRVENGRSDVIPHITTDTINVVAGLQHDISFIKFLRHSITVRLEEDSDGSFYSSSEDRKGKEWNIRLRSEEPTVAFDTIVVSDSMIVASYLPAGTYTISQSDSVGWNHLGYIINDTLPGVRATDTSLTITVQGGIGGSIVFVNTTVKFDTSKYRTFSQLELSVKSAKLKLKKKKKPEVGFIYPVPNGGNIRDTVLGKVIRKGAPLTFGRAFTNKDSAKKYGWVTVTKGKALEKMLPMTTAGKYYTHVKAMKDPKNSKLNNHLLGELVAFKVNMQASDNLIVINTDDIPGGSNLGDLRYQDSDTTSFFHNQQLRALADFTDSVLTYGKVLEQAGAVINYAMLDTIFSKVNRAFLDTIGTVMEEKDTISYFPLRIRATMKLADNAEFLKRDYTIPPRQPGIALNDGRIPEAFVLEQNYPNPFNPVTTIEFSLPEDALLTLTIYNVLGQEIMKVLENEEYGAGYDYVEFDGSKLSSGVYFYHVKAVGLEKGSTFTDVKKMVVLK